MFSDLGKDFTWIQRHERIIIVAMMLAVAVFGLNKWFDKSAIDASNKAAVAQQIAQVQHDADVKIAAAVAQQTALFNQQQQVHEQEMATLVAAVASRDSAANQRVTVVTQPRTPTQAVVDLQTTYTLAAPVTVTADGADVPTVDLQQFTVAKIEGDTAKADLTDTRKELDSTQQMLASSVALGDAERNQVAGLQVELKDAAAASKAEIASVKAAARKSKLAWFKGGVVVGFIGGLVVGHYTHI